MKARRLDSIGHSGAAIPEQSMIIVGCSAEKTATDEPLPALDLYNGGCVPALRARLQARPYLRARVRFLSAQHGFVTADTQLDTYDRPLDPARAVELRPRVWACLHAELLAHGTPDHVLIIADPLYLVLVADLLAQPAPPRIQWIPDHAHGWLQAAAILDEWGW